MKVRDFCSKRVVTIAPGASIFEAAQLMRKEHVGDVVCQDQSGDHAPLGILTDRDIVVSVLATGLDAKTMSVSDSMSSGLTRIGLDDGLADAIEVMSQANVRRVPVVDSRGMLAGVLSMDDVIGVMSALLEKISRLTVSQCWQERVTKL